MTWTKTKTAAAAGAAVILAIGATRVVLKEVHSPKAIHLAAGVFPQTLAELNAWYVEPLDGQNAATINLRGIKARQIGGADQNADLPVLGKGSLPAPGTPLPAPLKSALAAFQERNRAALRFFSQGTACDQSRYPIDLSKGFETLLPHLAGIKSGMQITEMSAVLDAENGQGKSAADDVLMTLSLARSLKGEPVLISQLVRVAGVAIAADGLNQVVNRTTLPPESLGELSKAFQSMEDYDVRGEGFNRAIMGENIIHQALLENRKELIRLFVAGATGRPDAQSRRLLEYLKKDGDLKPEQRYLETTYQQVLSARQAAFPGRLKEVADLIRQRTAEATDQGLLLSAILLSGTDVHVMREARCLANLRLALTAVALEQFRAAHDNRYPAALSELTPTYLDATLMDPFDGQPLRYRKQGAGYVLYSIGPDLKDNSGERMGAKGGDLVFTVVAPPTP